MSRLDLRAAQGEDRPDKTLAQRALSGLWLIGVWLGVTGSFSPASVLGGLVVVVLLMAMFRHRHAVSASSHQVHPVMLVRYALHFLVELARANIEVARAVLSPGTVADKRAIIEVPLPESSRLVGAILANAVSLTPGTSIIEVRSEPPAFHVHVLDLDSADRTRSSIAELHWRLVSAIGPRDSLEDVKRFAAELRARVADESGAP